MTTEGKGRKALKTHVARSTKVASKKRPRQRPTFGCLAWVASQDMLFADDNAAKMLSLEQKCFDDGVSPTSVLKALPPEVREPAVKKAEEKISRVSVHSVDGDPYHLITATRSDGWFAFLLQDDPRSQTNAIQEKLLSKLLQDFHDGLYLLDTKGRIVFASGMHPSVGTKDSGVGLFGVEWASLWMGQGRVTAEQAVHDACHNTSGRFEDYAFAPDGTLHRWTVRIDPISAHDDAQPQVGAASPYILCICRDITASSQDHERLELALYAGAISGGWIWDEKARLLRGDQRMAATLAVTVAQMSFGLTLKQVMRRVAIDDRPALKAALRASIAARSRLQCELRIRVPDGRGWTWVEADGLWEVGQDGHVIGLPGILLDIDEKKRQALKREALLGLIDGLRHLTQERAILDLSSQVMGETIEADRAAFADVDAGRDLILITALWSRAPQFEHLATMASFAPLRALYQKLSKGEVVAVPDVLSHPLTQHHSAALIREKIRALFYVPLFEDGVFRALAMVHYAEPHRWDRINMSFILTVADRGWAALRQNRAQEDLRRINGTLEEQVGRRTRERDSIWAITDDFLASMDMDGRLRHVNPSWTKCADLDLQSYRGRLFLGLVHPQDRPKFLEMLQALRANRIEPSTDLRLRFEDESWHTFNWTGFRDNEEIFLIGRDITERIVLEDQLRQSQKMEAVGQLTGGLAHDFNNILGGISGALALMRRRIGEGQQEGLARYITAAQEATDRAAALTHRLLAFSRRQTLDPTLTEVNELVLGMNEFLRRTLGPSVRLQLRLDDTVGPILIDRNQLENALLNLCINARDAMPDGGVVTIETKSDEAEMPKAGDATTYVCLAVSDTGIGMSQEVITRAFDPFFTTKPIGKGTGLGLSMIYGFASQSGGRVEIASTIGEGTCVQIWLPLYKGAVTSVLPATGHDTAIKRADLSHLRLLLVEDDATLRFTLHEMLTDRGIAVDVVETGAMAMTMLADHDKLYDILMTDVGLPGGVNGRQLADAARLRYPDLAVLFMTGYAEQTVFSDQQFDESMHILAKPFSIEMLDEKLARLADTLKSSKKP